MLLQRILILEGAVARPTEEAKQCRRPLGMDFITKMLVQRRFRRKVSVAVTTVKLSCIWDCFCGKEPDLPVIVDCVAVAFAGYVVGV